MNMISENTENQLETAGSLHFLCEQQPVFKRCYRSVDGFVHIKCKITDIFIPVLRIEAHDSKRFFFVVAVTLEDGLKHFCACTK